MDPAFLSDEIDSVIENNPELSPLFMKLGKRHKANPTLTQEEILLLSLYLMELVDDFTYFPDKKLDEEGIFQIFTRIGGDPLEYDNVKTPLHDSGLIGLNRYTSERKQNPNNIFFQNVIYKFCPTLTPQGALKIDEMLGKETLRPYFLIKAGEKYSGLLKFERFLVNFIEFPIVNLTDTYIGPGTLEPMHKLFGKVKEINILTGKVKGDEKDLIRQKFAKFKEEGNLEGEIRVMSGNLHDRYLLNIESNGDQVKAWTIGHSIKDLGSKDSMIYQVQELSDSLVELFNIRWDNGKTL